MIINNLTKLTISIAILSITIPVTIFYLKHVLSKRLKQNTQDEKTRQKDIEKRELSHLDAQLKTIYLQERQPYYYKSQQLFNRLMKEGILTRNEIFYLLNLINRLLGSYVDDYKNFYYEDKKTVKGKAVYNRVKGFKNTAHEIYVKLKNQHLFQEDFEEIIAYLEECESIHITNVNINS